MATAREIRLARLQQQAKRSHASVVVEVDETGEVKEHYSPRRKLNRRDMEDFTENSLITVMAEGASNGVEVVASQVYDSLYSLDPTTIVEETGGDWVMVVGLRIGMFAILKFVSIWMQAGGKSCFTNLVLSLIPRRKMK